ncbi:hypothetical protein SAMN06264364_1262 [Quadrisphaera granulorum]|uniref:Uncharacterized protein n=1 Tax=Quadrisphaera granulorum TaxID=317664 RepID=A0A315ZWI8_9ACTN|nr:hypothetical protein BXY45_1262 [Quadrisphaera granulorum]SZE98167.1 hypothetical protein SAMN06264364_1262 [Quadrisphaera granulorum]
MTGRQHRARADPAAAVSAAQELHEAAAPLAVPVPREAGPLPGARVRRGGRRRDLVATSAAALLAPVGAPLLAAALAGGPPGLRGPLGRSRRLDRHAGLHPTVALEEMQVSRAPDVRSVGETTSAPAQGRPGSVRQAPRVRSAAARLPGEPGGLLPDPPVSAPGTGSATAPATVGMTAPTTAEVTALTTAGPSAATAAASVPGEATGQRAVLADMELRGLEARRPGPALPAPGAVRRRAAPPVRALLPAGAAVRGRADRRAPARQRVVRARLAPGTVTVALRPRRVAALRTATNLACRRASPASSSTGRCALTC